MVRTRSRKLQQVKTEQNYERDAEVEDVRQTPDGLLLHGLSGVCAGRVFAKQEERGLVEVTLGRVKGNHVWVKDDTVSQKHARIEWRQGSREWWLFDLETTNGTFVNDVEVTEQGFALKQEDFITIGGTNTLRVQLYPYQDETTTVGEFLKREMIINKGMLEGQVERQIPTLRQRFHDAQSEILKELGIHDCMHSASFVSENVGPDDAPRP